MKPDHTTPTMGMAALPLKRAVESHLRQSIGPRNANDLLDVQMSLRLAQAIDWYQRLERLRDEWSMRGTAEDDDAVLIDQIRQALATASNAVNELVNWAMSIETALCDPTNGSTHVTVVNEDGGGS